MASILKNPGPLLTSQSNGNLDSIPLEWRSKIGTVRLVQEEPTDINPDIITPTGVLISSACLQTRTNERKKVSDNLGIAFGSLPPMVSQTRLNDGEIATRTRTLVAEGTDLGTTNDPTVLQADQNNLGVGKVDQTILTAPLPGPNITSSFFDTRLGDIITQTKTRSLATSFVDVENIVAGFRHKVTREGVTALVATKVDTTDPIPGAVIPTTRLDPDGVVVSIVKQSRSVTDPTIVFGETIVGGLWTKTSAESDSSIVDIVVVESRAIPGPVHQTTRIDDDGQVVTVARQWMAAANVVSGESINGTVWVKQYREDISSSPSGAPLTATQVTEFRTLNLLFPMVSTRIDPDGVIRTITKYKSDATTFVDGETLVGSLWTKTSREPITDKVVWKVVEQRNVAVTNAVLLASRVDDDAVPVFVTKQLVAASAIITSETITGVIPNQLWNKFYGEPLSDKVAYQVTEFRGLASFTDPSHTIITTRINDDGTTSTITKCRVQASTIVPLEVITSAGVWTKIYAEPITNLVAWAVYETRPVAPVGVTPLVPSATINAELEVATKTEQVKNALSITPRVVLTGTNNSQILSVEQKVVSDKVSQEVSTTRTWLPKSRFNAEVGDPIPAQFKPFFRIDTSSAVVTGTPAVPGTFVAAELAASAEQENSLLQRGTAVFWSKLSSLPVPTLTATILIEQEYTEKFGGLMMDRTKTLDKVANISLPPADNTDPRILSEKTTIHGPLAVKEVETAHGVNAQGAGFPTLVGGEVDEVFPSIIPYSNTVRKAGTSPGTWDGTTLTEVKPIDAAREMLVARTLTGSNMSQSYVFPAVTNVNFPPRLLSVGIVPSYGAAAGNGAGNGTYAIYNGGSEGMRLSCEASGSSVYSLDVQPVFDQVWGQNIPCYHVLFLSPHGSTYSQVLARINQIIGASVSFWPVFRPQSVTIICTGTKQAGRARGTLERRDSVTFDFNGHVINAGFAQSAEASINKDFSVTTNMVRIPPTIHGAIGLNAPGVNNSYTAAGSVVLSGSGINPLTAFVAGQAFAYISPATIPATSPSAIPSSGWLLHKLEMEPYKLGYSKVFAELVLGGSW